MQSRFPFLKDVFGPLGLKLVALVMVLALTGLGATWGSAYGQQCVSASGGSGDEDNSDNDDDNKNDDNDNGGASAFSPLISCDVGESVVGAQPRASDTEVLEMGSFFPYYFSADQVLTVVWVGGGSFQLTHDPIDAATTQTPLAPAGLRQLRGANIQLLPHGTPNNVNLTLHYSDLDVQGLNESQLRLFYFAPELGAWVEVPASVNAEQNFATWVNANVGAFSRRLTRFALFG